MKYIQARDRFYLEKRIGKNRYKYLIIGLRKSAVEIWRQFLLCVLRSSLSRGEANKLTEEIRDPPGTSCPAGSELEKKKENSSEPGPTYYIPRGYRRANERGTEPGRVARSREEKPASWRTPRRRPAARINRRGWIPSSRTRAAIVRAFLHRFTLYIRFKYHPVRERFQTRKVYHSQNPTHFNTEIQNNLHIL